MEEFFSRAENATTIPRGIDFFRVINHDYQRLVSHLPKLIKLRCHLPCRQQH